ncbi:Uncharacterised protein [Streptococcus pneumoniae]|nr:Uncharacterised protein [Streptococcus pneumoniae]
MFELTYKDCYHVERTLKYEDHEALMLTLSGCVTLPDTLYVTSLTFTPIIHPKSKNHPESLP